MKRIATIFTSLALSLALPALWAQNLGGASQNVTSDMEKSDAALASDVTKLPDAQLAMSVSYYPVTAGDVYTLAFAASGTPVRYTIPVDSTYKIRVANLGVINCSGLTYLQLKSQVESLVLRNYPMGGVQFVLSSPSTFLVSVTGEVQRTIERNAWALTRLSTFVTQSFTPYASSRSITIQSADGKTKNYDLFLALRNGDLTQDPFLRPGDKIIVNRYDRKITLLGAVEREGTYELLPNENLKEAVERYGNGLTEYADTERIILRRQNNSKNPSGDTVYLEPNAIDSNFVLENADSITISSRIELRDTMFFEGAVGELGLEAQNGTTDDKDSLANPINNRIPVSFMEGENLATLVRRNSKNFFPTSDLRNAYLIRNEEKLLVNLEDCLYKSDYMSDYFAQKDDTLYVPYMQNTNTVLITGEVKKTSEIEAWPLKRLSTFITELQTDYSSVRNIEVTAVDGTKSVYDLFQAERYGKMEHNPYIKPGEVITLSRLDRKVSITGAVERPGTYELLENENLKELIEIYGGGLAPLADTSRIELYRRLTEEPGSGEKSYLDNTSIDDNYELLCYDSVLVSSYSDLQPVVFVEGAINPTTTTTTTTTTLEGTSRVAATFNNGEDYAYFVRRNKDWFRPESDLANAYIIRDGNIIPMDLTPMLYDASFYANTEIQANDTLIVPFRQYFVSVAGAVALPGRYPYIPNRTWDYYIGLAGGFDFNKNSFDSIKIRGADGKRLSKNDIITPETTITANSNSFYFKFNRYAPIITTTLTAIISVITVKTYLDSK